MFQIKVLPNLSLKEAICLSLKGHETGSYQLNITTIPGPRIKNSTGVHILNYSKIRVAYDHHGWYITEFKFSLDQKMKPTNHKGDYELLDEFTAEVY